MILIELNDLVDQWVDDAKVNRIDPDRDILNIPNLHSKYASQIVLHNAALRVKRICYKELLRVKTHYYSGNLNNKKDLADRNWEPFVYTTKGKTDIESYLAADPDLNKSIEAMGMHEDSINFCELVVKEISNRTWQIKSYLDYSKYKLGN
jgi:hypothetical protein